MFPGKRAGFTLVELLVVIAIIGVMVGLLLPAVQAAREASRRSQCANNFKQLGLAMHNYHDTYKVFPYGLSQAMNSASGYAPQEMTWMPLILPFIEQQNLHDLFDFSIRTSTCCTPSWTAHSSTIISTLQCPSDGNNPKTEQQGFHGNYVMSSGSTAYNPSNNPTGNQLNGLFYSLSKTKMAGITDGTSNTLLASELIVVPDPLPNHDLRGRYYNGREGSSLFSALYPPNTTVGDVHPYCQGGVLPVVAPCGSGSTYHLSARSYHPGGVQVGLSDGSVRFTSDTINLASWQALATRAGHEVIPEW